MSQFYWIIWVHTNYAHYRNYGDSTTLCGNEPDEMTVRSTRKEDCLCEKCLEIFRELKLFL